MHRWWAFTPPVWCEFGGFSRYNFYSVGINYTYLLIDELSPIHVKLTPIKAVYDNIYNFSAILSTPTEMEVTYSVLISSLLGNSVQVANENSVFIPLLNNTVYTIDFSIGNGYYSATFVFGTSSILYRIFHNRYFHFR